MSAEQPEFEVGARVTFHPYERAFGVIVREVLPGYYGDERVVYRVEGMDAKSFTTGKCIEESKLYEPHAQCATKDELERPCPNPAVTERVHDGRGVHLCEQCARNVDTGAYGKFGETIAKL